MGGSFDHNLAGITNGQGVKWDAAAAQLVPANNATVDLVTTATLPPTTGLANGTTIRRHYAGSLSQYVLINGSWLQTWSMDAPTGATATLTFPLTQSFAINSTATVT